MVATFDALLAQLAGAPSLPGARCRGRHHLFDGAARGEDPEVVAARHAQAAGLCDLCPARGACREWFDTLPKAKRPRGIVAGIRVREHGDTAESLPKGERSR